MADMFSLVLNGLDWNALNELAIEKGFKSTRELIDASIKDLSKFDHIVRSCSGQTEKTKNNYKIPKEVKRLVANLCCIYSCNPSKIFFRFVILPLLIEAFNKNQAGNGS